MLQFLVGFNAPVELADCNEKCLVDSSSSPKLGGPYVGFATRLFRHATAACGSPAPSVASSSQAGYGRAYAIAGWCVFSLVLSPSHRACTVVPGNTPAPKPKISVEIPSKLKACSLELLDNTAWFACLLCGGSLRAFSLFSQADPGTRRFPGGGAEA